LIGGAAISTLVGGWQRERYLDSAISMLLTVPSDDEWPNERSDAAFALAQFVQKTGDRSVSVA